jgi:hypothetical protein
MVPISACLLPKQTQECQYEFKEKKKSNFQMQKKKLFPYLPGKDRGQIVIYLCFIDIFMRVNSFVLKCH